MSTSYECKGMCVVMNSCSHSNMRDCLHQPTVAQIGFACVDGLYMQVECINLLQAAVTPNNTNNFPFNAPPVRPYNLLSFDNATCDDSSVLGPRLGGECIKCEPLGVKTVSLIILGMSC